jgi:hypothetical protein
MLTLTKWMTLVFVIFISVAVAQAQATRTWVSGVGDDANPCSRTAPCKTFAGAISKTAAGGEIDALDPGGYGAVTITKAITIDGGPGIAGVLVSGTNGIIVSAGATDVVILRNLDINGVGTGVNGVQFNSGAGLFVENSTIYGFTQHGINFAPSTTSFLSVDRTSIRNSSGKCVYIKPGTSVSASAAIADSRFEHCSAGVRADDRSQVIINRSLFTGNTYSGVMAYSSAASADIVSEGCVSSSNGTGIVAQGSLAKVNITNTTSSYNGYGIYTSDGGSVVSFGNNHIVSNTSNGSPTGTVSQQ